MEGAHHAFAEQLEWHMDFCRACGHEPVSLSLDDLLGDEGQSCSLWVMAGLVYSGMGDNYKGLSQDQAGALLARRQESKPLIALHSVVGGWDDRPELDEVWDGRWDWSQSRHSPVEPFPVKVADPSHPLAAGLSDFEITDELYYNLHAPQRSHVVLNADYQGQEWPLAWTSGGLVYFGLGHDMRALENSSYQGFLRSAYSYLLG